MNDTSLDLDDMDRVIGALIRTTEDSDLPDDHTDLGDGNTPEEIVAIAYSYYFE